MSDTEIIIPYLPRKQFLPLHNRTTRWTVCVAHRRAGKTVCWINDLIRDSLQCTKSQPRHAYVAPYRNQAKDIAWDYLKRYTRAIPGVKVNESDLFVMLPGERRIRLYGADNPQAIEGGYLDGVVCDEYQHWDPAAYTKSIRPMLSDRSGWAAFLGKPNGVNDFHDKYQNALVDPEWTAFMLRASESGILSAGELADARRQMSEDAYNAEYECSFAAATVGAYFAKLMEAAEIDGRVCRVPYDPRSVVDTWWDIGRRDANAIWFTQSDGRMVNVIDYEEDSFQELPHYAAQLSKRGYVYGRHHFPHDIEVVEWGTGNKRIEVARSLFGNNQCVTIPRIEDKQDSIEAARLFLPKCRFDRERTERGRLALKSYRKKYDEARRVFASAPLHDWASAGADAFQGLAMGHRFAAVREPAPARPRFMTIGGGSTAWMGS